MSQVRSAAKALIHHQHKFLVIKEVIAGNEVWDLPGGKIEYGESPQETMHREIKEEIGLKVEIEKSVGVWHFISKKSKTQVICHTFLCKPFGKIKINLTHNPAEEEIIDWQWLTLDEILSSKEIVIPESLTELLRDFQKEWDGNEQD